MDRCTSSVVGMNQNGIRIRNAGMKTRIIMRTVAPLPARSLRTQSRIESGSRSAVAVADVFAEVRPGACRCSFAHSQRLAQRAGTTIAGATPRTVALKKSKHVEVVPPQRDSAGVHLEGAAHPELKPQRPEDQRVGALGQHRVAFGGDAVESSPRSPCGPRLAARGFMMRSATTDGGESDVLPLDVVGHQAVGGVEVLVLQCVEEGLDGADVVDVGVSLEKPGRSWPPA